MANHGIRPASLVSIADDPAKSTHCTACHGKHNSYQGDSLIVLRDDGTTSNKPTDPVGTLVTPEKCGKCHTADDGGAASDLHDLALVENSIVCAYTVR